MVVLDGRGKGGIDECDVARRGRGWVEGRAWETPRREMVHCVRPGRGETMVPRSLLSSGSPPFDRRHSRG